MERVGNGRNKWKGIGDVERGVWAEVGGGGGLWGYVVGIRD